LILIFYILRYNLGRCLENIPIRKNLEKKSITQDKINTAKKLIEKGFNKKKVAKKIGSKSVFRKRLKLQCVSLFLTQMHSSVPI